MIIVKLCADQVVRNIAHDAKVGMSPCENLSSAFKPWGAYSREWRGKLPDHLLISRSVDLQLFSCILNICPPELPLQCVHSFYFMTKKSLSQATKIKRRCQNAHQNGDLGVPNEPLASSPNILHTPVLIGTIRDAPSTQEHEESSLRGHPLPNAVGTGLLYVPEATPPPPSVERSPASFRDTHGVGTCGLRPLGPLNGPGGILQNQSESVPTTESDRILQNQSESVPNLQPQSMPIHFHSDLPSSIAERSQRPLSGTLPVPASPPAGVTLDFDDDNGDGFSLYIPSRTLDNPGVPEADSPSSIAGSDPDSDTLEETGQTPGAIGTTLTRANRLLARRSRQRSEPYMYRSPPYGTTGYTRNGKAYDLNELPAVSLGPMDRVCTHCCARYFACEENQNGIYFKCCQGGKIPRPNISPPIPLIENLIKLNPQFLKDIIYYNNAFAFGSLGISFKNLPRSGQFPVVINGQIQHRIGPIINEGNERYAQLYVLDGSRATDRRCELFA